MIYLFDLLEFQVLAAAKGMTEYYGFPIERNDDAQERPEEIRYAVYQMAKDGILKQDDYGMVIQQPYAGLMDTISRAETVTVMDRGQYRMPRRCVYASQSQMVIMESSTTDSSKVCLSGMNASDLFQDLKDLCILPEARLAEEMGDYDFDHYWQSHVSPELWNTMMGDIREQFYEDDMLESEDVYAVFSLRDKASGQLLERLILIDTPMEYGVVYQHESAGQTKIIIEPYHQNNVEEILKNWWRLTT